MHVAGLPLPWLSCGYQLAEHAGLKRGMQFLRANQVLVLVLSDLFFSIGDETLGHVKLWALTGHQQYDNYLHGLPQLLGIVLCWCQHQPEDQLSQAARQLRFQVCHQVLQKHLRVQSPAASAGMDQLRQHERKKGQESVGIGDICENSWEFKVTYSGGSGEVLALESSVWS